jgi:hypothetical protein
MEMRQSRTDVLEDHTDEGQPTPRLEDMGEPLPRYVPPPPPSDPVASRRPGSGPYSVPRPRERDPQSELESLLQRVPARRPILPALLLVLAILVSAGLLYVAFFGVPKNIPYLRDVRRMLRI